MGGGGVSRGLDHLRLPYGVGRRAPELQDVPAQLVGQAQDAADDRIGGARRATTGSGAAAEDQTPQAQYVLMSLGSETSASNQANTRALSPLAAALAISAGTTIRLLAFEPSSFIYVVSTSLSERRQHYLLVPSGL